MSLSLKESCQMYDRYCRRNSDTPTFQEFNSKHFTCLPASNEVFDEYKRVLTSARRAQGLPVTRRLPSLFKKMSQLDKEQTFEEFKPSVQVKHQSMSHLLNIPSMNSSMKMNIRSPKVESKTVAKVFPKLSVPKVAKVDLTWSRESYSDAVKESQSVLLKEPKGHMVHLVPSKKGESFESLACKLTKSTWESLRGKSEAPLKMRDGSIIELSSIKMDEGDLAEFIQNRKAKIQGPHFIRFERI